MKKVFAFIIAALMLLSLSGCAELEKLEAVELPPLPTAVPENTAAPSAEDQPTAVPEESVTDTPAPMVDERANQTIVNNRSVVYQAYDPAEGKELILTFAYDSPLVFIDGRDEVAKKINDYLALLDESHYTGNDHGLDTVFAASGYNMMLELAQDNYAYAANSGASIPLEFTSSRTAYVSRADSNIISMVYSSYQYTGGEHGTYADRAYVFDAATGEKLTLDRITTDFDAFTAFLVQFMVETVEADDSYYSQRISKGSLIESTEDYSAAFSAILREGSWYFDNAGLVIFSDVYEFGPYEAGFVEFTVPYDQLSDKIHAKYLPEYRGGEAKVSIMPLEDMEDGSMEITDLVTVEENGDSFCIVVEGAAYDVELCRVDYSDKFFETAQLWYASYLQNSAVQICTVVPEGMPDLMISYSDAAGERYNLVITRGETNGSVELADESISAVG